jgi:hypothetical protein
VLRIEAAPIERERFSIDQVDGYLLQFEQLADQRALIDAEIASAQAQLRLLDKATPKAPVDERERVRGPAPALDPEAWAKVLRFADDRRAKARAELRGLTQQRSEVDEKIQALQREIARHDLGAFSQQRVQVVAMVQGSGKTPLVLEYFVPGASWMPTYELHFAPARQQVTLKTGAQVWQASGERWEGVELSLSTAIPGHGIDMPELLTWTLGEQREWMPSPRAKPRPSPPSAQRRGAMPRPQADSMLQARRAVLRQRLARLQQAVASSPDAAARTFAQPPVTTGQRRDHAAPSAPSAPRPSRSSALASPPPTPRPEAEYDDYDGREVMDEPAPMTVSSQEDEGVSPISFSSAIVERMSGKQERTRQTSLELFEPRAPRPPQLQDPKLPAALAGGLDYVYRAAARSSVPSDGQKIRIPLASEAYPVKTFYEATPALAETAFLTARGTNKSERPILRGPAAIFVDRDFTGDGQLETTGEGGKIELPLGADEDIRITRRVEPKTETKGLFHKDEITTYRVVIEVGNYKDRAVELLLHDQLPKTNNEKIKVELVSASPKQAGGPDAEGALRWAIKVPAKKTQRLIFAYRITRPENWRLYQR